MSRSYNDELQFLEKISKNCWRIKKGFVPNMQVRRGSRAPWLGVRGASLPTGLGLLQPLQTPSARGPPSSRRQRISSGVHPKFPSVP